ncbi:PQQ-binding-like beta-propeller repeat protein [Nocardia sp. CA-107356]|uniref:outer membrane protein assembly factor BamB family protein n=1 Tax=Nocardia sp. CA-107356 TaxID=3239972 RepID=UPI003D8A8A77
MKFSGWKSVENGTRTSLTALLRAGVVVWLVAGIAACGSDSPEHHGPTSSDTPALNLSSIKPLDIGPHDAVGFTATGLYTVTDDRLTGIDPRSGKPQWVMQRPGLRPDSKRISLLDKGGVLLVGWQGETGSIAYAADTGRQLWTTPDAEWYEYDDGGTQLVRNDPRTGTRRWSVDPATLGCAIPLPPDTSLMFPVQDLSLFRCPLDTDLEGEQLVGALADDTGALLWKRQVPDRRSFTRGPANVATVRQGTEIETIDAVSGQVIGRRSGPDSEWRFPLHDGSALAMDSSTLKEDKELRLEETDRHIRWTVPLRPTEEEVIPWAAADNVILGVLREVSGNDYWVVAFDTRTGERTVVAGPHDTRSGAKPLLQMSVDFQGTLLKSAPWGALIPGKNGTFAIIPTA